MADVTLLLPFPPSVNHYWRTFRGRMLISAKGRAYRDEVAAVLLEHGKPSFAGRLHVEINAHPPDRRKRDLDNLPKAVLDALTHGGLWDDDEQIDDLHVRRCGVVNGGEIVIRVSNAA